MESNLDDLRTDINNLGFGFTKFFRASVNSDVWAWVRLTLIVKNPIKENELFRIINRMMDSHEAIGRFRQKKPLF